LFLVFLILQVPLFSTGSKENKKKVTLCSLSLAVDNNILIKTLLGSPFKPPFLGIVVDLRPAFKTGRRIWGFLKGLCQCGPLMKSGGDPIFGVCCAQTLGIRLRYFLKSQILGHIPRQVYRVPSRTPKFEAGFFTRCLKLMTMTLSLAFIWQESTAQHLKCGFNKIAVSVSQGLW